MARKLSDDEVRRQREARGESTENNSVPPGHRTKCRSCGAVDKTKRTSNSSRSGVRCAYCGCPVARRRAPKKPNIISFVVNKQLNGAEYGSVSCVDLFSAEQVAYEFIDNGPVARVRVAQIVELLDNDLTGNVRVLRYENFRQRSTSVSWQGGCQACRGRGLVAAVIRPSSVGVKAVITLLSCVACNGLGGELTRKRAFGRSLK